MEDFNKDVTPGATLENAANTPVENNHLNQDSEPAFSDEEDEVSLRLILFYISIT